MLDAQVVKPVQSAASRRIQRLKSLNEGHQPSCQRAARRHRRRRRNDSSYAPLDEARRAIVSALRRLSTVTG